MASGESDELQRQADTSRMWNGGNHVNPSIMHHYACGTTRSAAVATERTDDVVTAFPGWW
ncbi:hypothetical protein [Geotalea sp. SG265]|uniref:hypothetical protein n=1 Tax=Geotalea sp. SG265 TaxID=2922867 RepID=UPI001FAFEE74|nr:hypothetical protein [Geotalea sp. SG265]